MAAEDETAPLDGEASGEAPAIGGTIGRFVVLGALGSGGMGVVLAAWDPTLDRKVAVKLLRRSSDTSGRLEREAQAMARLQHPNVATVYEIGTVGQQRFVAMELVDGATLDGWMQSPHPWRAVVAMFRQAGRGLEAAHAAGLVHRDFKPDNVLVGSDGRPRVSDFGLAGGTPSDGAVSQTQSKGGTPAYMAPEQARGEPADARSDQFSFCVSLWEALYGERPFAGDAPPEQRHAPERPPRGRTVPAWLHEIVARGLEVDPARRWPSMTALLEALSRDPAEKRRRWLAAAGSIAAVAAVAAAGLLLRNHEARVCGRGADRLAGVWDDARRAQLERAFVATGVPGAAAIWQHTAAAIDDYAHRWAATHDEACRATRLEGRQSETLLDLRMGCLERRRATLAALGDVWLRAPSKKALLDAPGAAQSLPPLDECSDVRALTDPLPLPRDAAAKQRIAEVRAELDRTAALGLTNDWAGAKKASQQAVIEADATGYAPLQAEARRLVASSMIPDGDPQIVETAQQGARLAALGHDDRLAADALITLVVGLSSNAARYGEAMAVSQAAAAFVARAGDPPDLLGRLHAARGRVLLDAGKPKEAVAELRQALPLLEQARGPKSPEVTYALVAYGGAIDELGDHKGAHDVFAGLVKLAREVHGPDSTSEAMWSNSLGMVEEAVGHYREAERLYRRAFDIHRLYAGDDNEAAAELALNLGNAETALGELDAADAHYVMARETVLRILGREHAYVAIADVMLGALRRTQGRLDEALALQADALRIALKAYGPDNTDFADIETEYARTLAARGDTAEARRRLAHDAGVFRARNGDEATATLKADLELAALDAAEGRCATARPTLVRVAGKLEARTDPGRPLALAWRALARCDVADGDAAAAVTRLERAVAALSRDGSPADVAAARAELEAARRHDARHARR